MGSTQYFCICHECTSHCSSDDGTDSSEFTGISNCEISPTQVDSTCDKGALVAGKLPVIIPHEEVGDTLLSVCVSKQIYKSNWYCSIQWNHS